MHDYVHYIDRNIKDYYDDVLYSYKHNIDINHHLHDIVQHFSDDDNYVYNISVHITDNYVNLHYFCINH